MQFILGVHEYIFQSVAQIYEGEKRKHRIIALVPFIIVQGETIIKHNISAYRFKAIEVSIILDFMIRSIDTSYHACR